MELDKEFFEQLNSLNGDAQVQRNELDKRFFYVVTSFFAFSILVANLLKSHISLNLLVISWSFNILALLTHLSAFFLAQKDHQFKYKLFLKNGRTLDVFDHLTGDKKSAWGKASLYMDYLSWLALVLAIAFLLIFCYVNLNPAVGNPFTF